MTEITYEKVKQEDQDDTLLGIITRDKSKKTKKEYEERLLAAYDMVDERWKHVNSRTGSFRRSYSDNKRILSQFKENMLDVLSPWDEQERSIYGRCIDFCISDIEITSTGSYFDIPFFPLFGILGGGAGVLGAVGLSMMVPPAATIMSGFLGVGGAVLGYTLGLNLDKKKHRRKIKKMIAKEGFLDELMELE